MRILFSVRRSSYVRHYDSVLRARAARGHEVYLATEGDEKTQWPPPWVSALAQTCAGIRLSATPSITNDPWFELATRFRQARFYLRFLHSSFQGAPALLARTRVRAPRLAVRLAQLPLGRSATGRRLLTGCIDVLERSTGTEAAFVEYLRELRPDVVVLTPLVILKTSQIDLARAARVLGIRSVFAVASWDHLSSKGALSVSPNHVIVWNDVQKREAAELHGVDPARVIVTGSQVFDEWFTKRPSTSREAFCARVGLRPDRPILLYVCSSLLEGSRPEPEFVVRWARHMRASAHPVLRDCGILIRPHFKRGHEWKDVDLHGVDNLVCWPPVGAAPIDATSKTDYFDSLFYSAAVVGLNTSAMIEAAILDRPVHTVLLPEFHDNQEGTVHFHYLLDARDGVLRATRCLDDHARDVAATLEGRTADPGRSARFVRTFVRPGPADVPATIRFVEALETIASRPAPNPEAVPRWASIIHPILRPFATKASERVKRLGEERRARKEHLLREHRLKLQLHRASKRKAKAS